MRWPALAFAALLAAAPAQDPVAAFHDACVRVDGAIARQEPADIRQRAYSDAWRAWLQVPVEQRRPLLVSRAAQVAFHCGEFGASRELSAQAFGSFRNGPNAGLLVRSALAVKDAGGLALARDLAKEFELHVRQALLERAADVLAAADRLLRQGNEELGLWSFEQLVEASDGQVWALSNRALALRHVGDVAHSEACYRQALRMAPDDPLLWNDLGLLLVGAGRHDEGITAFVESVRRDPDPSSGSALLNLALAGRGAGLPGYADPLQVIRRRLERDPDAALGFARRVCLDLLLGRDYPVAPASDLHSGTEVARTRRDAP